MLLLCAGGKVIALVVVHLLTPDIDRARNAMIAAEDAA